MLASTRLCDIPVPLPSTDGTPLLQVWDNPVTEKPHLEPLFAAAMQGVELCFLLMGEFVRDSRSYVAKRPRIELLANDIRSQCALLSEVGHVFSLASIRRVCTAHFVMVRLQLCFYIDYLRWFVNKSLL